jgi:hypothetical protein
MSNIAVYRLFHAFYRRNICFFEINYITLPSVLIKDNPKSYVMPRMIYDYTKSVLERVSFDPSLFKKELRKALKALLPYELEQLRKWLEYFTTNKPELQSCISVIE